MVIVKSIADVSKYKRSVESRFCRMLCLVRSLLVGAMSQHAICDVDFVLLRMIFFCVDLRSGPLPNLGVRSVSTVCFCLFFACRCCIDVLTGAESAEMKSSSSSRTASSYSLVSG